MIEANQIPAAMRKKQEVYLRIDPVSNPASISVLP
jgi:hypothetical protein